VGTTSDRPHPEISVSHPAWCDLQACRTYHDHDGNLVYVHHAVVLNGRAQRTAALSQREIFDDAGRSMELDEAYVTVRHNRVEELHLPARHARIAGDELQGEVGAMVDIALALLNRAR